MTTNIEAKLEKKDVTKVLKKYIYPVKKFSKENRVYIPQDIYRKINEDMKVFTKFLDSFKEDSKEPFSKHFTQTLGQNYINTYINKFMAILDILKCSQNTLKDSIMYLFKESFSGVEGKVLLEGLLYIREDFKTITKPDLKKYFLNLYNDTS